jgi:hypothetical protein
VVAVVASHALADDLDISDLDAVAFDIKNAGGQISSK